MNIAHLTPEPNNITPTQINWNSLKVLDKYLYENIFCQKRAENIF